MEDYLWEGEVAVWVVWAPLVLQLQALHLMWNKRYYRDYYDQPQGWGNAGESICLHHFSAFILILYDLLCQALERAATMLWNCRWVYHRQGRWGQQWQQQRPQQLELWQLLFSVRHETLVHLADKEVLCVLRLSDVSEQWPTKSKLNKTRVTVKVNPNPTGDLPGSCSNSCSSAQASKIFWWL